MIDSSRGQKEWVIEAGYEYRFEVPTNNTTTTPSTTTHKLSITLLEGQAEIFGTELAPKHEYIFGHGEKMAVYSWTGATISVKGETSVEYVSGTEIPMHVYLNCHQALQLQRTSADHDLSNNHNNTIPNVLLVGVSRKTVARILANYSARQGGTPMLVDLDVSSGCVMFPGVLSTHVLTKPIDLEEGLSGDGQPEIAFFYGHTSYKDSPKTYKKLLHKLAETVRSRLEHMKSSTGSIIIAPGDTDETLIEDIVEAFQVTCILVVGNERLHSSLEKKNLSCTILKLPKSGGVVSKDAPYRKYSQHLQYRSYFYGLNDMYTPFSITLAVNTLRVFRYGRESTMAPMSALPLGAARRVDESRLSKVEIDSSMLYAILGICHSPDKTVSAEESSNDTPPTDVNMAGFLYITGIDDAKHFITVLSPCPLPLPGNDLILGQIRWIEK